MIQKTYHITDYTDEKLSTVLAEVAAMPEYQSAGQILTLHTDDSLQQSSGITE